MRRGDESIGLRHMGGISGIIVRSLLIQFAVVVGFMVWRPESALLVLSLMVINALVTALVIVYWPMHRTVTLQIEDGCLDPSLQIARETLPHLRRGLNEETARSTAEIIQKISDVDAVAVTDRERVLAYIGAGSDHHLPGGPIMTRATKEVLATGEVKVVSDRKALDCPVKDCPLQTAVVAPLKCRGEVAGTVKLYRTGKGEIPPELVRLAVGIAQLLSMQMELAELDRRAQLVTQAQLDALHAQINPHFLFNTLNTIIMFSRTNPEMARRLLVRLAAFFRQVLKRHRHGHFNTLREEMEYIDTYLYLEKARFQDKLHVKCDIDPELLDYHVPVLTLQPLVENAVKHGIMPKVGPGTVSVSARLDEGELLVVVSDDGVGIPRERLPKVLQPGYGSGTGVGLSNVHERLKNIFGENYGLRIVSEPERGTSVYVRIPLVCHIEDRRKVS